MVKVRWGCWLVQAALLAVLVAVWACEGTYQPRVAARWDITQGTGKRHVQPIPSLYASSPMAKIEVSLDAHGRMHLLTRDVEHGNRVGNIAFWGFGLQVVGADGGIVSEPPLPADIAKGEGSPVGLSVSDSGQRRWLLLRGPKTQLAVYSDGAKPLQIWTAVDRLLDSRQVFQAVGETDCLVNADGNVVRYRLGLDAPLPVQTNGLWPTHASRSGALCEATYFGLPTAEYAWILPDGSTRERAWPRLDNRAPLNPFAVQEPWVYVFRASRAVFPPVGDAVYRVGRGGRSQRLPHAADPPPGTTGFEIEQLLAVDARGTVWYCGRAKAADGGDEWVLAYAARVPRWRLWLRAGRG